MNMKMKVFWLIC